MKFIEKKNNNQTNTKEKVDLIDIINNQEQQLDFIPQTFDDYLGQEQLKQKLHLYTHVAKERNEPLDHLLLFGPPGVGKTTLARIMAHIMMVDIKICSAPMIDRTGDLVAVLSGLTKNSILFIDEIHRLPSNIEEVLYTAMESFRIDVIIGQGTGAKTISLPLNPFTLIGATTKSGSISAPLRSRFGIIERLDFYTPEELALIIMQAGQFFEYDLPPEVALAIGRASRGTPRIAKKLVRRIRDFCQYHKKAPNCELVKEAFSFLGIDQEGLTQTDYSILKTILIPCNGGPVGLETLAALVGEDPETIEQVYEPYLMRMGYLEKTARGRQIMKDKLIYLKKQFLGQLFIDESTN